MRKRQNRDRAPPWFKQITLVKTSSFSGWGGGGAGLKLREAILEIQSDVSGAEFYTEKPKNVFLAYNENQIQNVKKAQNK